MNISLTGISDLPGAEWEAARSIIADDFTRLQAYINTTWSVAHNTDGTQKVSTIALKGIVFGTLAEQPTGLSIAEDGLLFFVSDFGHLVKWDGSAGVWRFAPGDVGNGFFRSFGIAPQEVGWQKCDGSATTYLVINASTLTTTSFTTPNLNGSPAYIKGAGSYAGSIAGAVAPGATTSIGGHTDNESSHTHTFSATTGQPTQAAQQTQSTAVQNTAPYAHTHPVSGTTDPGSAHQHTLGGATASTSVDTTGEPAHLGVAVFFRR